MQLNWNLLSKYRAEIYALSILWIMAFHVYETLLPLRLFQRIPHFVVSGGNIGVDVFLLLSGVSMYYSARRRPDFRARDFYARRYKRLLIIYLGLCAPFLLYWHLRFRPDAAKLWRQLSFLDARLNSFWFLACIALCYLLFPLLYRLPARRRGRAILLGLVLYEIALLILAVCAYDFFANYEIMLCRLPVFAFGVWLAPRVYEKRSISVPVFVAAPFVLFLGPELVKQLMQRSSFVYNYANYFLRMLMGFQGLGVCLFLLPFLAALEHSRLSAALRRVGALTLELYVVHIIVRRLMIGPLGLRVQSLAWYLPFWAAFFALSFACALPLNHLLSRLLKRPNARSLARGERGSG